jgi:hypothetical protein
LHELWYGVLELAHKSWEKHVADYFALC